MSFNDREAVALIGGGHAFGRAHGACPKPPCGDGKGPNTFTSGFEGAWTSNPAKWDNEFFINLFKYNWELVKGPGTGDMWIPKSKDGDKVPNTIMLTSDIAMSVDDIYQKISKEYAEDLNKLNEDFAKAWYKLTTGDMGSYHRCIGDLVPPPQAFQNYLPASPSRLPNYVPVRMSIEVLLKISPRNVDAFINLAYRCASTFRQTDYSGGCNGARIRFLPESNYPENNGTDKALKMLEPIKKLFGRKLSWTDLIVLAGMTALESENDDLKLKFCGGGMDADRGVQDKDLSPRNYKDPLISVLDDFLVKGLTKEEGVALACRQQVGSQYYQNLLSNSDSYSKHERALLKDEELKKIVELYARNENTLLRVFAGAWTKLMTADRFLDNRNNACENVDTKTKNL